ncbi:hypothetical protein SERLA73DRAFT_160630 [Serpula lacrymans var. lacrymans S7.3]|uniref:Peptidase A1 domain-containing protein n=1 Tax=Serpula lacrymans var. lacrymans (strain S7.3) TaxID=936435 RepID=F8PYY5_SERL3|nr:hypothetical protein SERLA73DRAFT_160630 [Serpula lacrymans var. lacrymans S7.3]
MKLDISISVLLTSLLYAISVSAVPARRNANPGMVTLPLKRLHQTRTDIHPHLFIQQHKNRGHRRLARMTGRSEPSADELRRNLMKRVSMLESELVARSKTSESEALVGSNFSGRFRTGKAAKGIAAGAAGAAGAGALGAGEIAHGQAGADMPVGSNGTMTGDIMGGNGTMVGNGTATSTGSMTGNSTTTGTGSMTGNGTTTGTGSTTGKGDTGKGATGKGTGSTTTGNGTTTTGTGSTTGNGTTTGTGSTTGKGTSTGKGAAGKGTVGGGVATGTGSTTGNGTTTGTGSTTGNGTTTGTGSTTGNGTTTGTGSTSGNGTTTGNSTGVSQIDIQAAQNGGLTAANTPTANNSLGLDIEADDVGYIATVQIGTPAQDFKILMDSGSADFWVGSETCQAQGGGTCGNHTFLGSQSSTSFKQSTQQFQVEYGSGAVAGVLCQDNVNIAGLALNAHTFGVANEESVQFASDTVPFDGLMGLAQSTLSEEGVPTPVESLASAGLISSAITSFKISRLSDQLNDGEVTFGGLDATKFVANSLVTFANVNTQGFWEGAMTALTVNGADSGLTNRTAILDTGTTLVMAPPQDAATINQMLGGACDSQGTCTVPCTMNSSLALTFGGAAFAIDPSDITVLPMDLNDPTGTCMSGIQAGSVGGADEWLVGDVFLKNAYFSTDISKNQISLAQLAQS